MVVTLCVARASWRSTVAVVDERARPPAATTADRFDQLFRANYGSLYGLTYRLVGDRQEAEDVVQEAFIALTRAAVLHRPDDEVLAWLRRVCLNVGHNRVRTRLRAGRHLERAGRLAERDTGSPEPLPTVLREEMRSAIRRSLAPLPERHRACLLLRHSGHSYAEIATTLEIAVGSVGVLLARAEKAFRKNYENQESER